jgi:type IV pilus assembly protein PilC
LGLGLVGPRGLAIYVLIVAVLAVVIGAPVFAVARGRVSPEAMRLAMRAPWIGGWLQTMALERLAWSLAMALESGADARRSIRLALRSTQNPYYTSHLDAVDRVIMNGGEFHEALRGTGAFPDDFLDVLQTAELAGTHSESLARLSAEYQERAKATSRAIAVATTFLLIGLVILLLVVLIFKVAMIYFGAIYGALNDIGP